MPRLSGAGASRGFTLLEVLIALSLMAVLAVLGWRGLDSVLVTRERLTRSSADLAALCGWADGRGLELEGLTVERPTLEDVFLAIAGDQAEAAS